MTASVEAEIGTCSLNVESPSGGGGAASLSGAHSVHSAQPLPRP